VENPLAEALLSGEFNRGDQVRVRYDAKTAQVVFEKVVAPTPSSEDKKAP
jgi:ATP-dependent Clp protease ATP-binding subunit ClpA